MSHKMRNCTLVAINGKLCLPDCKPDADLVLRITSTPLIETVVTSNKKIIFCGRVCIEIEYVASSCNCTQPIHYVSFELPYKGIINSRHIKEGLSVQLHATVTNQEICVEDKRSFKELILLRVWIIRVAKCNKTLPQHLCESKLDCCKNCKIETCYSPKVCCDDPCKYEDCPNEVNQYNQCDLPQIGYFDSVQLHDCCECNHRDIQNTIE